MEVSFHDEAPGEIEASQKYLRRRLAPTFELDKNGEVWRVNYNNECRDSATSKPEKLETVRTRLARRLDEIREAVVIR